MNEFDVFQWANEVDEIKNNVTVELFLFNKNYTPFKIRYSDQLTSNVKSDKTHVVVKSADEQIDTGRKKFGAMLGDHVEVGCNSVLNPGTVVGKNSNIYPLSCVRGVIPANSIFKTGGVIVEKK